VTQIGRLPGIKQNRQPSVYPSGTGRRSVAENAHVAKGRTQAGERLIIGDCVITNEDQRTRLLIDGQAPILSES
jgi:hypothetical protein